MATACFRAWEVREPGGNRAAGAPHKGARRPLRASRAVARRLPRRRIQGPPSHARAVPSDCNICFSGQISAEAGNPGVFVTLTDTAGEFLLAVFAPHPE